MPWRALAVLLLVCTSTLCWVDACTYGTPHAPAECTDRWVGLLDAFSDEDISEWCGGELHAFEGCNGLGYTLQCGEWYYVPDSQAATVCLAQR
jgi:hypothetical protein